MSVPRSRASAFAAAFLAVTVIATGCGGHPASNGQTSATPTTAPTSASPAASSSAGPSATAQPSLPAAPASFRTSSVTFVSSNEAFCLGTAPGHGTLVVRTLDRGQTWARLAAPLAPLGSPGSGASSAVWGTRFASASLGFVFGDRLWQTADGGRHWALAGAPAGQILSLAAIDGQVLALVAKGSGPARLLRRSLAGGPWVQIASVKTVDALDPTDLIATQAGTAAVLSGTSVLVSTNGGLSLTSRATPSVPGFAPDSVAVTSSHALALLLVGQGAAGSTEKVVYTSPDSGAHWAKAGTPSNEGDPVTLAGGSPTGLVLATASGASWLDRSNNGGHSWATVLTYGDGGEGWADLGFTTTTNAVVVHGPADSAGNSDGRPARLLLSANGGATWQPVSF